MLKVTSLYARSLDLDSIDVMWEVASFEGNPFNFEFTILRAETSFGPWDIVAGPFSDQYYFRDTTPVVLHKLRKLYYLLRIKDKTTGEVREFGPTAQLPEPNLETMEMVRQEDVYFREKVGRKCWVFPIRTFGAYCTCRNTVTGQRTRSNCNTCFGTGYLGGFYAPVEVWIQFDPAAQRTQPTTQNERKDTFTSARMGPSPLLKSKDLVIEAENVRWRVETMTPTQRLRATVHQELTLFELPKTDIEYKVPLDIPDLRSLSPSPVREYTNPQHTDGDSGSVQDLLAPYEGWPRGTVR